MGLYQGNKSLIPQLEVNMQEITADEVQSAWNSYSKAAENVAPTNTPVNTDGDSTGDPDTKTT